MLTHKLLLAALTVAILPIATHTAYAEEFVISGNGSGADNSININTTNTTEVKQENVANVENKIEVKADTGNNTADSNTGGDVDIKTGDINIKTDVVNVVNNSTATVDNNCNCNNGTNITIKGNGSGSNNTVNHSPTNNNTILVNNYAAISNNTRGYANTGGNSASGNTGGNISIQTGNITVEEKVKNATNKAKVSLSINPLGGYLINIFGNGADSDNTITINENSDNILSVNNVADIYNNSFWDLITGNNKADRNTNGDVAIKTGDIKTNITIENDINESEVIVECGDCKKDTPEEPEKPGEPEKPTTPPPAVGGNNGGNGRSDDHKGGDVLKAVLGDMLPVTGTPWFILAILGNLLLLFFGTVLRLRSGRSPGFAYAI